MLLFSKIWRYSISITISPILFLCFFLCFIYQKIIQLYLIYKHGENFGGFLSGKDARMAADGISKRIVQVLFIVDFQTTDSKIVYDLFLDQLTTVFEADNEPKLSCSINRDFGYCYYLKDQISPCNVVSTFTDAKNTELISMKKVQEFMSQISCEKMPKNNRAMIEFIISDKPIKYEGSKTTFAVIFRFPHCVMDGPAVLHFLFYNNILSGPKPKQFTNPQSQKNVSNNLWSTVLTLITRSYDFLILDLFRAKEWNYFHRGALTHQRLAQWISEDEYIMVPRIQEIKKRTGAAITNILTVAIAISMKQFAKIRNKKLERMTTVSTIQTHPIDFSKPPKLTNTFAMNHFDYPLSSLTFNKTTPGNLKGFLDDFLKCYEAFLTTDMTSIVDNLFFWASIVPLPILNIFSGYNITFILTNVGNLEAAKFWSYDLKNILFFSNLEGHLGFAFVTITYRGKLHIGLTVDQKYLHHAEEADEILEGTFRSLNQLLREVLTNK